MVKLHEAHTLLVTSGNEREAEMNAMQCVFTGPPRVGKSSFWQRVLGIIPERLMASTDITSSEGSVRINIRGTCGFAVHVSELEWKKLMVEEEMEGFVALVTQQGIVLHQKMFHETFKAIDMELNVMQPVTKQQASMIPGENSDNLQADDDSVKIEESDALYLSPTTSGTDTSIFDASAATHSSENLQPDDNVMSQKSNALDVPSNTSGRETSIFDASAAAHTMESLPHWDGQQGEGEQYISDEKLPSPSQVLEQALIMMRQAEATKSIDSASFVYFTDTGGQPEFQEALSLLMAGCNTVLIVLNLEHDLHSSPPLEYLPSLDEPPIQYHSPYTVGDMLCQSLMSVPIGEGREEEEEGTSEGMQNAASVFFIGTHKDTVTPETIKERNRELIDLITDTPQYQSGVVKHCSADNIIFAVDNFSPLHKDEDFIPIRRAIQSLVYCNSFFRVKARTSWLFMGVVFQKLSESQPIITLDQCQEIARQCSITGHDIDMALKFLHRTIGAIRHYNTENLHKVVILKPQLIINLLSQFMQRAFKKPPIHRAIFDSRDVQEVVKECKFVNEHLMLNLTHDLLLSAPHPDTTVQHPRYYLTCMLPIEKAGQEEYDPIALLLTLKGFVLPTGIGRATITSMLQKRMHSAILWKINYQKLFRNSLEFTASTSNVTFKVKCTKRYLSISVLSAIHPNMGACVQVRTSIEDMMKEILMLYKYGESSAPTVGFWCNDVVGAAPHLATLTPEGTLRCSATKNAVQIPRKLQHWFMVGTCMAECLYSTAFRCNRRHVLAMLPNVSFQLLCS